MTVVAVVMLVRMVLVVLVGMMGLVRMAAVLVDVSITMMRMPLLPMHAPTSIPTATTTAITNSIRIVVPLLRQHGRQPVHVLRMTIGQTHGTPWKAPALLVHAHTAQGKGGQA